MLFTTKPTITVNGAIVHLSTDEALYGRFQLEAGAPRECECGEDLGVRGEGLCSRVGDLVVVYCNCCGDEYPITWCDYPLK